jgi:hypothetical protein
MACTVESIVSKLLQMPCVEFRWKIKSMLERSKFSRPNMTMKELKAIKSLRLNKDMKILQVDKEKLFTLQESGVYESSPKDLTAKSERKIQKLLSKYKTTLPIRRRKTSRNPVILCYTPLSEPLRIY